MGQTEESHSRPAVSVAQITRAETRDVIGEAVDLLQAQHGVGQISAYTILVQASVDSQLTVRETAHRICEAAHTAG